MPPDPPPAGADPAPAAVPGRVAEALAGLAAPVCGYVYDGAVLQARAAAIRAALPPGAQLLYAVKANGHPRVVRALAGVCGGLEVASGGELTLALAAGARRIAFAGPAKTDAELAAALTHGVTLNVESPLELRRIAALAGPGRATVALRVNRAGAGPSGS